MIKLSETDMPAAIEALWARIEYIGEENNPRPSDQTGDWRRDLACAKVLKDLKYTDELPARFRVEFMEFFDPISLKPDPVEGLNFVALTKDSKNPGTGDKAQAGDRFLPHLFNLVASVLHILCEDDKELAVEIVGRIDKEKAFRPGEVLRILCGHGMKDEAVAHLRALCHSDRDFAINTANNARCEEIPFEQRVVILKEEGIVPGKKRSRGGKGQRSYVDNPEQQRTTLGDKLRLVFGQPVDSSGNSNDDGGMSTSAAVAQ